MQEMMKNLTRGISAYQILIIVRKAMVILFYRNCCLAVNFQAITSWWYIRHILQSCSLLYLDDFWIINTGDMRLSYKKPRKLEINSLKINFSYI